MKVSIFEADSGDFVVSYQVALGGLNYNPSEGEYYDEAWRCATEDGVVQPQSRGRYTFGLDADD